MSKTIVTINDDFYFEIGERDYTLMQHKLVENPKTLEKRLEWKFAGYYTQLVPLFEQAVKLAAKNEARKHETLTIKKYLSIFKTHDLELRAILKDISEGLR
jgi:hypothetical protein